MLYIGVVSHAGSLDGIGQRPDWVPRRSDAAGRVPRKSSMRVILTLRRVFDPLMEGLQPQTRILLRIPGFQSACHVPMSVARPIPSMRQLLVSVA